MCIYCGTKHHRKIYREHFGPIPKDSDGRSYEIHHIDGNHNNNELSNLKCVSIQEHYDIHYAQGDWAACLRMKHRMSLSVEETSRLASLAAKKANIEGKAGFGLGHASAAGKLGGKKGGAYAKENKTGIFNLTPEQHKIRHRNSVLSRLRNAGKL
jgi:hypothetical protein